MKKDFEECLMSFQSIVYKQIKKGNESSYASQSLYMEEKIKHIAAKNIPKPEEVKYLLNKFMPVSLHIVNDGIIDTKKLQEVPGLKSQKITSYIFSFFNINKNKKVDFE
jgi:hypothetical protein